MEQQTARMRILAHRNVLALGAATAVIAVAALAILALGGGQGAQAETVGASTVVGIDMYSDQNNTGTTLGTINPCFEVLNQAGTTFTIDTFLNAVPANEDLDGF